MWPVLPRSIAQSLFGLSSLITWWLVAQSPALLPSCHIDLLSPPSPAPSPPCPPRSLHRGASTPVETGLVWLPTVEMMDWRLTYGKGRGLQVNKSRAVLNMEERKKTCSSFWLERREKETGMWFKLCALKPEADMLCLKKVQEFHSGQFSSLN